MALRHAAGAGEFAPVEREAVEPLAAEVIVDMLDIVGVGHDRQVAALLRRPDLVGGGQMQRRGAVRLHEAVDAAVAAEIAERAGDHIGDRRVGGVLDLEGEHRRRQRGIAVVMRDEGRQRLHPDVAREALVMERIFGDREAPDKGHVRKMRHAGHRVAIGAEAETIELADRGRAGRRPLIGAVQHQRLQQLAVLLGLDGEMAVAVELVQLGAVADRPVDHAAGAGQREAAGPDAAEREHGIAAARAAEDEAVVDPVEIVQHQRHSLLRCLSVGGAGRVSA